MDNRTEPVRSACRHASGGHTRTCEREWMTTTGTSVVNYLAHTHDEIDLALVPTGVPVGVSLRVRSNARVIRGFLGTELTAWHVRRSCYRDRFRLGGGTRSRSCCFSTLAGLRRRWLIFKIGLRSVVLSHAAVNGFVKRICRLQAIGIAGEVAVFNREEIVLVVDIARVTKPQSTRLMRHRPIGNTTTQEA